MKHKVDSFINGCKRDVRVYAKEYDDVEISNLEKSQKDIDRVNREVNESKVYNNITLACIYHFM